MTKLEAFCRMLLEAEPSLVFRSAEIGALPLTGELEPLHQVLEMITGSTIYAFEPDHVLCEKLNAKSEGHIVYLPEAIGKATGKSSFFETVDRACCSTFEPDIQFAQLYNALDGIYPKSETEVSVTSLDDLKKQNHFQSLDLIKMDIQGGELNVFEGAIDTLKDVLFIVTEVEFVPLYKDQPLYSDIEQFLRKHGFMHHKFGAVWGRTLKPMVLKNDPNVATQQLWADAIFIKDIRNMRTLNGHQLLKMALFATVYQSPDLSYYCLNLYDEQEGTTLGQKYISILNS